MLAKNPAEVAGSSPRPLLAPVLPALVPVPVPCLVVMANQAPASHGPPIMSTPFTGFGDKDTVEDFLFLWNLQSAHVHADHKKAELYRCLDRKVFFVLKNAEVDFAGTTHDELLVVL